MNPQYALWPLLYFLLKIKNSVTKKQKTNSFSNQPSVNSSLNNTDDILSQSDYRTNVLSNNRSTGQGSSRRVIKIKRRKMPVINYKDLGAPADHHSSKMQNSIPEPSKKSIPEPDTDAKHLAM